MSYITVRNYVSSKASRAKEQILNEAKWSPCTTRLMTKEELREAKEKTEERRNKPGYLESHW